MNILENTMLNEEFKNQNGESIPGTIYFAEDFGVYTNNSGYENSKALQNAVDTYTNLCIIFSKGQYKFSDTITVNKVNHFVGLNGSTLIYTGTDIFLHLIARASSIKDIILKGNGSGTAIYLGTNGSPFTYGKLSNVIITNFNLGINLYRCWIVWFYSCRIINNTNGLEFPYVANAISFYGCQIERIQNQAILISGKECGNVVFDTLCCEGNLKYVKVCTIDGITTMVKNITFKNCYFEQGDINYPDASVYMLDLNDPNAVVTIEGGQYYRGFVNVESGCLYHDETTMLTIRQTGGVASIKRSKYAVQSLSNPRYDGIYANFNKTILKDSVTGCIYEPSCPSIQINNETSNNGIVYVYLFEYIGFNGKTIVFDVELNDDAVISDDTTISISFNSGTVNSSSFTYLGGTSIKTSYTSGLYNALKLSNAKRIQITVDLPGTLIAERCRLDLKIGTLSYKINGISILGATQTSIPSWQIWNSSNNSDSNVVICDIDTIKHTCSISSSDIKTYAMSGKSIIARALIPDAKSYIYMPLVFTTDDTISTTSVDFCLVSKSSSGMFVFASTVTGKYATFSLRKI